MPSQGRFACHRLCFHDLALPNTPKYLTWSGQVRYLGCGILLLGSLVLDLGHRVRVLVDGVGGRVVGGVLRELRLQRSDLSLLDRPARALAGLLVGGGDRAQELARGASVGVEVGGEFLNGDGGHLNQLLSLFGGDFPLIGW